MLVTPVMGLVWSKTQLLLCRDSFNARQCQLLTIDQEWRRDAFCFPATHSPKADMINQLQHLVFPLPWQTLLIYCHTEPRTPGSPYQFM